LKIAVIKRVKSIFDDKKIVEFIKKVEKNKNSIFAKLPVTQSNNSNVNSFNLNKISNNGTQYNGKNKPLTPAYSSNNSKEPNGQNAEFIWSVFTIPVQ
jgi:hypothetical protein